MRPWRGIDRGAELAWPAPQHHGCHEMQDPSECSRAGQVKPPESREASQVTFFCRLRAWRGMHFWGPAELSDPLFYLIHS